MPLGRSVVVLQKDAYYSILNIVFLLTGATCSRISRIACGTWRWAPIRLWTDGRGKVSQIGGPNARVSKNQPRKVFKLCRKKKKIVILMLLREFLKQSYDSKVTFAHYVFAPRTLITYDWNFRFYYALLAGLTSTSWVEGMKMSCSGKIIRLTQV